MKVEDKVRFIYRIRRHCSSFSFYQSADAAVANRTPKRGLNDQIDEQAKKMKLEDDSIASAAPANVQLNNKPSFVNASQLIRRHTHTTVQNFQEISDEELLEMAIQFEKDHPEYN